jgi:hypothetical protein
MAIKYMATISRRPWAACEPPEAADAWDDLDDWLDGEDIPDGVPFLISPGLEYDVELNGYFLRPALVGSSRNTPLAAAGDVRR